MTNDDSGYGAAWQSLALRRTLFILSVLALLVLPVGAVVARRSGLLLPTFAVCALAVAILGGWHHLFRCPSCRKLFFVVMAPPESGRTYQTPFTNQCLNCGCPEGAGEWPVSNESNVPHVS